MSNLIQKAKKYSKDFHKDHIRFSGESHYRHSLRVFNLLRNKGVNDETILVSALLHDILYYDKSKADELKDEFGNDVYSLLKEYRKIKDTPIKLKSPRDYNEKYTTKLFLSLAGDLDALLLVLADKSDNIATAKVFEKEERERIAERILRIYAPLGKFLGLGAFVKDMENDAFKILDPGEYHNISKFRKQINPRVQDFFRDATEVLIDLLEERGITAKISYRFKSIYAIHKKSISPKYRRKKESSGYDCLYDIVALRILVDTVEECYKVEDVLCSLWDRVEGTRDDYISMPKPNGYQTLQCSYAVDELFNAEIQIRTYDMHHKNEYGVASHAFYKTAEMFRENLEKDPDFLKKLNYWENRYEKKNSDIRPFADVRFNNIYVFTPKGDIIELPEGSTVLDFAFAVHAEIGKRCQGAMVNSRIAKLSDVLTDGDTVEIKVTKNRKKPNRDWLQFVKTRRARIIIRKSLRDFERNSF